MIAGFPVWVWDEPWSPQIDDTGTDRVSHSSPTLARMGQLRVGLPANEQD